MKIGIIAGCFDILHPGYIYMFKKSKEYCDHLVVALQTDPSIERPNKHKPIFSWEERYSILNSIRYIDEIVKYTTEKDLKNYLINNHCNVRILGDDYINKNATGQEFSEQIFYIDRSHGWSATKYKELLCNNFYGENK
jgi:glycerol-3-phosphate cytidylyltransferase